mgnify:CR=1 FL=1
MSLRISRSLSRPATSARLAPITLLSDGFVVPSEDGIGRWLGLLDPWGLGLACFRDGMCVFRRMKLLGFPLGRGGLGLSRGCFDQGSRALDEVIADRVLDTHGQFPRQVSGL